jgi:hypothetical protein
MSGNSKFDLDLAKGQEMEQQLAEFFKGEKVEVKSERHLWEKTHNHFVEYQYKGNKSGISVTEAEYWALMLVKDDVPVMTYIIPVAVLKELCRKYIGTDRDVVGGDDNNSRGILLPIKELSLACLNNDRE